MNTFLASRKDLFHRSAFIALLMVWVGVIAAPALTQVGIFLSLAFWIFWKSTSGWEWKNPWSRSVTWPLIGFFAIVVFSWFWSEYPPQSLRGIGKIARQILLGVMVSEILSGEKERSFFEKFFIAGVTVLIADSFFQYFIGRDFLRGYAPIDASAGVRLVASFGTYGKLACFLLLTLPYLFVLARKAQLKGKTVKFLGLMLLFILGLIVLWLTRSRGAFLAFFAGTFFVLLFKRQFRICLAMLVAAGLFISLLPRNVVIHLDAEKKEQSVVERFYLWDRALHVIQAKPLTGTGINTYAVAHAKYDQTKSWRVANYYAHNGYLQLAAETGIPSLILFLVFLINYFRVSLKNVDLIRLGLLAGILNFLIFACVDTILHNPQPLYTFWFLIGLQIAYSPRTKLCKTF